MSAPSSTIILADYYHDNESEFDDGNDEPLVRPKRTKTAVGRVAGEFNIRNLDHFFEFAKNQH